MTTREITVGDMKFSTNRIRPGLFYFSVWHDGAWIPTGDPIHGRVSDKKSKEAMVHYGKLAIKKITVPKPLPVEKVIEAFKWTVDYLLEQTKCKLAKRYGLIRLYRADAKDYADALELIEKGQITDGLIKLAKMDTAARDKIWGCPIVVENNDDFIMFLHENKYPNILSNGSVY